jgi:nicotinate-nucleotide adenylyltransferase
MNAIGILGGTFDPIHFGHLRMAIDLQEALQLSQVRFVPCYQPVHRKPPEATIEDRCAMVELAIRDEPGLQVDRCEIDRQGLSYTIDTVRFLEEKYPHDALCLILGSDALIGFTSWHEWECILEKAHLIIAHRPHFQLPTQGKIGKVVKKHATDQWEDLHEKKAGCIYFRGVTQLEISATDIRRQFLGQVNPRFLLPDSVLEYIQAHKIYQALE